MSLIEAPFISVQQCNENEYIVKVSKPRDLKNEYIPFLNYLKNLNRFSLGDSRLMNLYTWITEQCGYNIIFTNDISIEESTDLTDASITIPSHSVFKLRIPYMEKLTERSYIINGNELHKVLKSKCISSVEDVRYTIPLSQHEDTILSVLLTYTKNHKRLLQLKIIDIPVSVYYIKENE